jgi:hypothetical protein
MRGRKNENSDSTALRNNVKWTVFVPAVTRVIASRVLMQFKLAGKRNGGLWSAVLECTCANSDVLVCSESC